MQYILIYYILYYKLTVATKSMRTIAIFFFFFLYLHSYKPDQAKISTRYCIDPWLISAEI